MSYSDDLALDNSSKAKELILSDAFQDLWRVSLKDDSQSKKKWYTKEGGGLYATAAGGAITGFGAGQLDSEVFAGAIIIDDPLKVDDAERESERQKVNQRLNTTIKSRRNSRNTPIIIIMQRLHEDDMSGFVLNGGMGEDFYHLKLPAIHEGKSLWSFKHTIEELERERAADPRTFSAQMMQDPAPDDGTFFKREWFKRYKPGQEPDIIKYGCSDYAVTEKKIGRDPDFTEHGVAGFDVDENLYLVDWWSGQTDAQAWIQEQLVLIERHEPVCWAAEAGTIRRAIEPFLAKEMQTSGIYCRIEWIASNQNKTANARSFQALAAQGKVYIPETSWGERLIQQLLKFPEGKYDDAVDVCGLFGRLLNQTFGPKELIKSLETVKDAYGLDEEEESWRV